MGLDPKMFVISQAIISKIDAIFLTKGLICLGLAILLFVTQTATKLSLGVVAMLVAKFSSLSPVSMQ